MAKKSWKRKLLYLLGGIVCAMLLLVISLPLWFPWILSPIGARYGLTYSDYERLGYGRFALQNAVLEEEAFQFKARRIESAGPTAWLWHHYTRGTNDHPLYLEVEGWEIRVAERELERDGSLHETVQEIESMLPTLQSWLPRAVLTNGVIRFGTNELHLPQVVWDSGALTGQLLWPRLPHAAWVQAQLEPGEPNLIDIRVPDLDATLSLIVVAGTNLVDVSGNVQWQASRLEMTARFGPEGWLPQTANARAPSFRIPAEELQLEGYEEIAGSFSGHWEKGAYKVELSAAAQPRAAESWPPVEVLLQATGDLDRARLEELTIELPWVSLAVSYPVEVDYAGELLSEEAELNVRADLGRQPWVEADGQIQGQIFLERRPDTYPEAVFRLAGTNLQAFELDAEQASVRGRMIWPVLEAEEALVTLTNGAMARASGVVNLTNRVVQGGRLEFEGHAGEQFLPEGFSYQRALVSAEISGPFDRLEHAGSARIAGIQWDPLAPLELRAQWRGAHGFIEQFDADLTAPDATLALAGSANIDTNRADVRLSTLTLANPAGQALSLDQPTAARFHLLDRAADAPAQWRVELDEFLWSGPAGRLFAAGEIAWPDRGLLRAELDQLDLRVFDPLLETSVPAVWIDVLRLRGEWEEGPARVVLDGTATLARGERTPVSIELETAMDERGLWIQRLTGTSGNEVVVSGRGFLPVTLEPQHEEAPWRLRSEEQIDFRASTRPHPDFWERIASLLRARFYDPSIELAVAGTLQEPLARLRADVREVVFLAEQPEQPVPRVEDLFVRLDVTRDRINLYGLEMLIERQPLNAHGTLPLGTNYTTIREWLDWRKGTGELLIRNARIAPFARLFPEYVTPQGVIDVRLALAPGGQLQGELNIADAALRPFLPVGSVQDIQAAILFQGDHVQIRTLSGLVGGEPIAVEGRADLSKQQPATGWPLFSLKVRGANVPLVREPELIVRSDLAIDISNLSSEMPLVSGVINLRDSFFLSDLSMLIPGRVARPERRPPYFSVEAEPFARWPIKLEVRGDQFMRVRSPIFRGEVSAAFQLNGTLREPRALGSARIDSGLIQFPFANLRVDQGLVTLTSEDPYRPDLFVLASSRTYGYDVRMEMTGKADDPVLEFSSTPPLSSEEIVLMLTTGELPREQGRFSSQQRAGRLALFLGRNILQRFGAGDEAAERLTIRSGEHLAEQGGQTYYLEYRLTDRFSLVGEYDRFNDLNAGVKWRVFSR
jgi:translocation and assembly module TamB